MKTLFFITVICVTSPIISWGQGNIKDKNIIAWGVVTENDVPRSILSNQTVYFNILDKRTMTDKRRKEIIDQLWITLLKTYPLANLEVFPSEGIKTDSVSNLKIVTLNILECQVYFKSSKWHTKMTFDVTLEQNDKIKRKLITQEDHKFNLLGYDTALMVYIKTYQLALNELLVFLDETFADTL